MSDYVVAVIDSARARFFMLEQPDMPEYESGPNLIELESLSNPTPEHAGKDLWANVKTGRNRGSSGQAHAYDDHRQNHMNEYERRFVQSVATGIITLAEAQQALHVVLVAEPHTLGCVREALTPLQPGKFRIHELAKDLSNQKPLEIHENLASKGLLPVRKRAVT